jgi:hypothetical protein
VSNSLPFVWLHEAEVKLRYKQKSGTGPEDIRDFQATARVPDLFNCYCLASWSPAWSPVVHPASDSVLARPLVLRDRLVRSKRSIHPLVRRPS